MAQSTPLKKRKEKSQSTDLLLQKAIDCLNQPEQEQEENDDACFGRYVGRTLMVMSNNVQKCILKNKIQNLICETQINLLQQNQVACSTYLQLSDELKYHK